MPIQNQDLASVLLALRQAGGEGTTAQAVAGGAEKGITMGLDARKAAFEQRVREAGLLPVTPGLASTASAAGVDLTGKREVTQDLAANIATTNQNRTAAEATAKGNEATLAETTRKNLATEAETARQNRAGTASPKEIADALGISVDNPKTADIVKALTEAKLLEVKNAGKAGKAGANAVTADMALNTLSIIEKQLSGTTRGFAGYRDVIGGEGAFGGRMGTESRQQYNQNKQAFAVQIYRAITGDTRLSDQDVPRALGLLPKIDSDITMNGYVHPESQAVIDAKLATLRQALSRAKALQQSHPELFQLDENGHNVHAEAVLAAVGLGDTAQGAAAGGGIMDVPTDQLWQQLMTPQKR